MESNQRGDATYLQLSMGFELRPSMGLERTWFLRGLAGRSRGTGHEKGRDVPAFSFLCKPRPAGIRTLGFEARGKTGARDPGVDIEDPLTSTMK